MQSDQTQDQKLAQDQATASQAEEDSAHLTPAVLLIALPPGLAARCVRALGRAYQPPESGPTLEEGKALSKSVVVRASYLDGGGLAYQAWLCNGRGVR